MLQDVLDTAKEKMKKSCEVYERDMMGLRAGRANPQLLDRILVDYYGTPTPINQVGNISVPEARLMVIAPWEPKMITPIEKATVNPDRNYIMLSTCAYIFDNARYVIHGKLVPVDSAGGVPLK